MIAPASGVGLAELRTAQSSDTPWSTVLWDDIWSVIPRSLATVGRRRPRNLHLRKTGWLAY
jgi:hypothetical protein